MACAWLLFFVLLHRLTIARGIIRPIFEDIFTFTFSLFFFARIFHILTDWINEKFIFVDLVHGNFLEFLRLFFIPQDYLFSLFGAIFGFILVFYTKTYKIRKDRYKYLDAIVIAFLSASLLWYLASLLGGQVYGIPFSSPLSITYTHIDSIVKDRAALFPLAFMYILLTSAILIGLYRFWKVRILPDGYIGIMGIGFFSCMIFLWEFMSGARRDMFYDYFSLGLNQIWALFGLIFAILWILRFMQKKL